MVQLRTIYPYGLNDCLGNEYKKKNIHVLVSNKFPPPFRKHARVFRGTIHRNNNFFSSDVFPIKLKHHLSHNLSDIRRS